MSGRLVIVGFDALDFRYLDEFEADLRHFSKLRADGIEAPLESTFPPWTGSAWPSMYTGCAPDYHGVFDFFDYRDGYPDEAPIVTRDDVAAPALWNYADSEGLSSIILNVPVTHPAERIDGVIVPGYLAPESAHGFPEGIRSELNEALGNRYRIYADRETKDNDEQKLEDYVSLIRSRGTAAGHLFDTREWDFAFIQVQKTDTVFHNYNNKEAFRRVYAAADDVLGRILAAVDENDTVIVCSDHGMGKTSGYTVYLNEILRKAGFVETGDGTGGVALGDRKDDLIDGGEGDASSDYSTTRLLIRLSEMIGLSPGTVYSMAERVGVDDVLMKMIPESLKESLGTGIDWENSRAYCRSASELGVRINLAGREPNGTVPKAEYDTIVDALIEQLSTLETPDGQGVFEWVKRRDEVYDGPFTGRACDVLVLPKDMDHSLSPRMYGHSFIGADHYDHKQTGIFIGRGPMFDHNPERLSLVDIAPTAMAALGLPVPNRMTGEILSTVDQSDIPYKSYDTPYGGGSDDSGGSEVTDRLEDLGYL